MIVVLTSNYNGAILQLAFQIRNEFIKIHGESVLFLPSKAKVENDSLVERYERKNSLSLFDKQYLFIAKRIETYKPEFVFVCDTNLITSRIVHNLSKTIPIVMVVHDVNEHPNYRTVTNYFKNIFKKPYIYQALKEANQIVLMSNHSYKEFKKKNPQFKNKISLIKLGAHVPTVKKEEPPELKGEKGFILFFGRLDKYKGIINLLKAYELEKENINRKIIIAGNGTLTKEEKRIIDKYPKSILLVKRYISDGEMIWLFKNASCTVLPYIEASQSGVLSMSLYFGKPVIVSNVEGLTEFVEEGKTGVIFSNIEELSKYMISIPNYEKIMKKSIKEYYESNLNWEYNIRKFIYTTNIMKQ